jgi:small nuclear ribonucleoprotein (snRNP)-like protein
MFSNSLWAFRLAAFFLIICHTLSYAVETAESQKEIEYFYSNLKNKNLVVKCTEKRQYQGRLIGYDKDTIVLQTKSGEIDIRTEIIVKVKTRISPQVKAAGYTLIVVGGCLAAIGIAAAATAK